MHDSRNDGSGNSCDGGGGGAAVVSFRDHCWLAGFHFRIVSEYVPFLHSFIGLMLTPLFSVGAAAAAVSSYIVVILVIVSS